MDEKVPSVLRRPLLFIAVATLLGVAIGIFQQGSIGEGLVLGLAVGVGVTIGLVLFEVVSRQLDL